MKLTAQVKLLATPEQTDSLQRTLERANAACNHISTVAWEQKAFRRVPLHRLVYRGIRERFGLSAQVAVRCIAKVVEAVARLRLAYSRTAQPAVAGRSACDRRSPQPAGLPIAYDSRILRWDVGGSSISIWTLAALSPSSQTGEQLEHLSPFNRWAWSPRVGGHSLTKSGPSLRIQGAAFPTVGETYCVICGTWSQGLVFTESQPWKNTP